MEGPFGSIQYSKVPPDASESRGRYDNEKEKHARWRWYEILLVGAPAGPGDLQYRVAYVVLGDRCGPRGERLEKLAQAVRAAAPGAGEEQGEVCQKGVETLQAQNETAWPGCTVRIQGWIIRDVYAAAAEYYLRRDFEEQLLFGGHAVFECAAAGGQQEPYHPRT